MTTLSVGGLLDAVAAQLNAVDFTGDQASEDLTADNWTTAANDAARIAEVMHEIVSAVDAVQDVTVDFADIDVTGDGFLASSRFVRVEWNRTA